MRQPAADYDVIRLNLHRSIVFGTSQWSAGQCKQIFGSWLIGPSTHSTVITKGGKGRQKKVRPPKTLPKGRCAAECIDCFSVDLGGFV